MVTSMSAIAHRLSPITESLGECVASVEYCGNVKKLEKGEEAAEL